MQSNSKRSLAIARTVEMKKICDKQAFKKKGSYLRPACGHTGDRLAVCADLEGGGKQSGSFSAVGGMISLDYANPNRPFAEGKQNDQTTQAEDYVFDLH